MRTLSTALNTLRRAEDGATAVEYALMVALIAIVVLSGAATLAGATSAHLSESAMRVSTAS